jgi:hypothetical protein
MRDNYRPVLPLHERTLSITVKDYDPTTYGPKTAAVKEEGAAYDVYEGEIPKEIDHFFLLIMSIIIFFMQCGFAFMEAGAVR